jgi:hypothetical protein
MRASERKARNPRARQKAHEAFQPWVQVGAPVTFRAEVMPGRGAEGRTFTVVRVDRSGRIELSGLSGHHAETEFEPAR